MKKVLFTILAVILVASISVAGTLAYLTGSSNEVTNTFVAAGGGKIVDSISLYESEVTYDESIQNYVKVSPENRVTTQTYDKVAPGMTIVKDPQLDLNIADGASVYIIVEIVDETDGIILWNYCAENLKPISGVTGIHGGSLFYVYDSIGDMSSEAGVWNGDSNPLELDGYSLLETSANDAGHVTIAPDAVMPTADEGAIGTLSFYAYVCQSQGFASAGEAYSACFGG